MVLVLIDDELFSFVCDFFQTMTAGDVVCTRVYEREWGFVFDFSVKQYFLFVPRSWFTFIHLVFFFQPVDVHIIVEYVKRIAAFVTPKLILCMYHWGMSQIPFFKKNCYNVFFNMLINCFIWTYSLWCPFFYVTVPLCCTSQSLVIRLHITLHHCLWVKLIIPHSPPFHFSSLRSNSSSSAFSLLS